ncbi:MAG: hypothetical protein P4L83_04195 [Nevskia sp.]|nr:hypothetical protein [Nevskia sp.]
MRRIAMGFVWFLVLWIGIGALGGGVAGTFAEQEVAARGKETRTFAQGYGTGYAAGQQFGRKYGGFIMLGALFIAVIGTIAGVLPGTKPKSKPPGGE